MLPQTSFARLAKILPLIFTVSLFAAVSFNNLFPGPDPYRCDALLNNGSWLHPPHGSNGTRAPFTNWQPDGCMLKRYDREDIHQCIGEKHMVFSGDSTTRQIFWAMGRLLDREKALDERADAGKHESYDMTFNGTRLLQIWNPWLETGDANPELTNELEIFINEKRTEYSATPAKVSDAPAPSASVAETSTQRRDTSQSAGLIMLGAGSWYALTHYEDRAIRDYTAAIDNVTDLLRLEELPRFGRQSMNPGDGVGNELFIAPVAPPFLKELPPKRKGPHGIQPGEIEHIDDVLRDVYHERHIRMLWSYLDLSRDQPDAMVDLKDTGFHVVDSVAEVKATILLNLRCNAKMDAAQGYPYDRTCCTDYGENSRPFIQRLVLYVTWGYVIVCAYFQAMDFISGAEAATASRGAFLNLDIAMFAVALLACFHADRSHLFAKGSKEYVGTEFGALVTVALILGVVTIRKTTARKPSPSAASQLSENSPAAAPVKEDHGVLSRDQTEEWKGWMQGVILIYHWTGASRALPVYIFVRLLVAAYIFQTGYGHTIYFLTKKDFSFRRVAAVLLRLNLLSCALPYFMGTDYMFYYFAPLVSYWFLIVYATMAIGAKYNDNPVAVASKICIAQASVWLVMNWTPLWEWAFAVVNTLFRISWDLHEWQFRANLDGAVVFVGMLCGLVYTTVQRDGSVWTSYEMAIAPGLFVLLEFWQYAILGYASKVDYNELHPFISFLPILGYVGLRNGSATMRNYYSAAAAWLGRCSLETFILQFHIFLAADTKGVLLLDAFRGGDGSLLGDRWRDLVVVVPVFLWLSSCVSDATAGIVKAMTSKPAEDRPYDLEGGGSSSSGSTSLLGGEEAPKLMEGYKIPLLARAVKLSERSLGDVRLRCAGLLVVMWVLNLCY